MVEYINYTYHIGVVLVLLLAIYFLCTKRYKYFELSTFVTIAILLFALPRLVILLLLLVFGDYNSFVQIEQFKVELTLGVSLLIIRCIHEIVKRR